MKSSTILIALATASSAFALPSVGPDYVAPAQNAPATYRDAENLGSWKTATPSDAFTRGDWWKLFADSPLNELETRALNANQDLRAAAARVEEARAAAGLAKSNYWPQIAANGSLVRERTSETTGNVFPNTLTTTYRAPLAASWEIDLFGRVRRLRESANADAEASAATFESVRLALTSEVAVTYFSLRATDQELALVRDTVSLRRKESDLVSAKLKNGVATDFDAARAETELATTEAEAASLESRRAALQNALAVLVGEPASAFVLTSQTSSVTPPAIPAGLPSDLLERRPDIAAAERTLAAANARIGVAKAAFFPAISLTGSAGYASADVDQLFKADSRIWSIGPSLYLPIFQGGRNRANLRRSQAAYEESVANFRQRVLVAFREVQDALTATRWLTDQSDAQERALAAAKRGAALAQTRYNSGYVAYIEVIDAQRTTLSIEQTNVRLAAQRLNNSVALIKALGGGWHRENTGRAVAAVSP